MSMKYNCNPCMRNGLQDECTLIDRFHLNALSRQCPEDTNSNPPCSERLEPSCQRYSNSLYPKCPDRSCQQRSESLHPKCAERPKHVSCKDNGSCNRDSTLDDLFGDPDWLYDNADTQAEDNKPQRPKKCYGGYHCPGQNRGCPGCRGHFDCHMCEPFSECDSCQPSGRSNGQNRSACEQEQCSPQEYHSDAEEECENHRQISEEYTAPPIPEFDGPKGRNVPSSNPGNDTGGCDPFMLPYNSIYYPQGPLGPKIAMCPVVPMSKE